MFQQIVTRVVYSVYNVTNSCHHIHVLNGDTCKGDEYTPHRLARKFTLKKGYQALLCIQSNTVDRVRKLLRVGNNAFPK